MGRIIRVMKFAGFAVVSPFLFLYVAGIAPRFVTGRGARGHQWYVTKRACSLLLWFISVKTHMSAAGRAALADDENSIIVVNHRSHLDGFTMMDTIPDKKWFTFAAKKELFQSGFLARGFKNAGLVEIDRQNGKLALETLTQAVHDMPARRSVVLFAEGTRTTGETLGAFKPGAILVARATGRAIRPIVICGADTLLPRDATVPRPGTVRLEVLEPFRSDPNLSVDEDLARLRQNMCNVFEGKASGL